MRGLAPILTGTNYLNRGCFEFNSRFPSAAVTRKRSAEKACDLAASSESHSPNFRVWFSRCAAYSEPRHYLW
jgi:hypothetical protein